MKQATTYIFVVLLLGTWTASAQELEYYFSPEGADYEDPFAVGLHNGARGLSGPFDLDADGRVEILVAQHNSAGGRVHVIENQGVDQWELVYSTAFIDSSASSSNARYATGADLDGDGLGEIVYVAGNGYREDNAAYTVGAYVWEYDGQGADNYGEAPASVANFFDLDGLEPGGAYAQKLSAADIDGDGQQELLVPANGASTHDVFYVLSVTGEFETGQAGVDLSPGILSRALIHATTRISGAAEALSICWSAISTVTGRWTSPITPGTSSTSSTAR